MVTVTTSPVISVIVWTASFPVAGVVPTGTAVGLVGAVADPPDAVAAAGVAAAAEPESGPVRVTSIAATVTAAAVAVRRRECGRCAGIMPCSYRATGGRRNG